MARGARKPAAARMKQATAVTKPYPGFIELRISRYHGITIPLAERRRPLWAGQVVHMTGRDFRLAASPLLPRKRARPSAWPGPSRNSLIYLR